ncbi:MAG: hypothetical protein ACXVIY_00110 [Mucilaginibacter sp.]
MKTQKLNLKSIKNVLSRAEMKKITAGSGGGPGGGGGICDNVPCEIFQQCNQYCHGCIINPGGGASTCL